MTKPQSPRNSGSSPARPTKSALMMLFASLLVMSASCKSTEQTTINTTETTSVVSTETTATTETSEAPTTTTEPGKKPVTATTTEDATTAKPVGTDKNHPIPAEAKLRVMGYGAFVAGMTVPEASNMLGSPLVLPSGEEKNNDCYYLQQKNIPVAKLRFMVNEGLVNRVEVDTPDIKTAQGAHIGMSESAIKQIYPTLVTAKHKYDPKGHYLTYTVEGPGGRKFELLFETDGQRVTTMRSGLKEQVDWVEDCQ